MPLEGFSIHTELTFGTIIGRCIWVPTGEYMDMVLILYSLLAVRSCLHIGFGISPTNPTRIDRIFVLGDHRTGLVILIGISDPY